MKRAAALALAAGVCLTGCTINLGTPPNEAMQSATAEPTRTEQSRDSTRAIFLNSVRADYPELDSITDDELMTLVDTTCDALNRGATWDELAGIVEDSGPLFQDAFAGTMATGAALFCPDAGTL